MQRAGRDSTPSAAVAAGDLEATSRVLGLDPGSHHTGWGVLEGEGRRLVVVAHGRLSPRAGDAVPRRLAALQVGLGELIVRWRPRTAVLESPFRGINARSLIVLAEARGALLAELARQGVEIAELAPAEVKSAVVGHGRADKQQVARMVALELGLDGEVSVDASDALAVALAFLRRRRLTALASPRPSGGPARRPPGRP